MPSGHDCLVNRMVWLWVAVTFFLVKSNKAQIGRDDLVSVHHAIVLPANNSAEDADNSFISLKGEFWRLAVISPKLTISFRNVLSLSG